MKTSYIKDESAKLFEYGERLYDNLILLSSQSKSLGPVFSPKSLLEFVQSGGNLFVVAGSQLPEGIRELGRQLDMFLAERQSAVVDHFNHAEGSDDIILLDGISENPYIISDETRAAGPILYKGIGHYLGPNPQTQPILRGNPTSYIYNTKTEAEVSKNPWAAGTQLFLVSVLQSSTGERVGLSGSIDMLKDEYLSPQSPSFSKSNFLFARDLTNWVFQRKGVLQATNMTYGKVAEPLESRNASCYRIKDEMIFSIDISLLEDGQQTPYVADDVQLELIMLDPYYRVNLVPVPSDSQTSQHYEAVLVAPDHYGDFTFKIEYKRPGLTPIEEKSTFTLRQFFHNEFPRFLPHAYPYYASCFSVLGA